MRTIGIILGIVSFFFLACEVDGTLELFITIKFVSLLGLLVACWLVRRSYSDEEWERLQREE